MFYYRVSWFDWSHNGDVKRDGFGSFFEAYNFCKSLWDRMTIEDRVSTFLVEYVRVDDGKVIESCDLSIRQIEEED